MRIKAKPNHYVRKEKKFLAKCSACGSTIILEDVYIAGIGSYRAKFCTDCIHSSEEAKKAAVKKLLSSL